MKLNQAGIDLIKHWEGCRLEAYPDPATGGDPWTIGYGCTGPSIKPGVVWTQDQADRELMKRLIQISDELQNVIKVDLNDNQFSAIISLAYNIGMANLLKSTLLKLVNSDQLDMVPEQFLRWDRAAGREISGLLQRRNAEKDLFQTALE